MKKRILVASLNWGLGHATRCIPIINALIRFGFEPIIASDGSAFLLLKKEFPDLKLVELPSYNITYSKKGSYLKFKLIKDTPKILKAIKAEHRFVQNLVAMHNISGIISDNRFGVYSKQVPSVFITHQLNVLSGNTTWLSTKLHNKAIANFDECWIPDYDNDINLSGILGHSENKIISTTYIGALSRFNKIDLPIKYDLMVLLSGPEPQRSILETHLFSELKHYKKQVLFVKGLVETEQKIKKKSNFTIYNYMTSYELEKAINESELILSRSGYTTIMDLAILKKKAFFIPTPGQFEQLYLAEKFKNNCIAPYCLQNNFSVEKLSEVKHYKGFKINKNVVVDFKSLFSFFESK